MGGCYGYWECLNVKINIYLCSSTYVGMPHSRSLYSCLSSFHLKLYEMPMMYTLYYLFYPCLSLRRSRVAVNVSDSKILTCVHVTIHRISNQHWNKSLIKNTAYIRTSYQTKNNDASWLPQKMILGYMAHNVESLMTCTAAIWVSSW